MDDTNNQKYERIAKALRDRGIDEARVQLYIDYHRQGRFERADKILHKIVCGGRRRRDGMICLAAPIPGHWRCKWHGGMSTGPKTPEGRARQREGHQRWLERMRRQGWYKRRAKKFYDQVFGDD
jgi:hypothetical protein